MRRYGHSGVGQPVEVVNLRVVALREGAVPGFHGANGAARGCGAQRSITLGGAGGDRIAASVWALDELAARSEEHTSELQSRLHLVCRLLLEKKKKKNNHAGSANSRMIDASLRPNDHDSHR